MNVLVDGEILLFGTVGEGFFQEGFTAMDVVSALAEIGRSKDVTVRINSGGGIAMEGVAIFNALDSHRGKVSVVVESIAASAASIIAMAGETVTMKTGAVIMVHDPGAITVGNSDEHAKSVEMLETLASSMADIYAEKTGRKAAAIREEMKSEIWLSAKEAVAKGYADKIDKSKSKEPTAFDYRLYQHAPDRMVALAEARSWKHGVPTAESSATHGQTQETEMTDAEKVAADKLAADKAAADKATADAKAGSDKAAADAAAAASAAKTETPEQITARAVADERKRAADIHAACSMVGKSDKATAFISEGKTLSEVVAALQADRAKPGTDISARHSGNQDNVSPFKKHAEAHNARFAK